MERRSKSAKSARSPSAVKTKRDLVDETLASSPALQAVYRNLQSRDAPIVSFVSTADVRNRLDMEREIIARILRPIDGVPLRGIGIEYRFDSAWDSVACNGRLNTKAVQKAANAIKKSAPHSISAINAFCAPSNIENNAFNIVPFIATLVMAYDDNPRGAHSTQCANGRSGTGSRPLLEPCWRAEPTDEDVTQAVGQFMRSSARLRAASQELARARKDPTWRANAAMRRLTMFQVDALLPITRAFFGAGQGAVILRVALTIPLARAKLASKREGAISRDDLLDLIWTDAHANQRPKPPYVKM